jgi:rhodanese-related sulfurtransferase
MKPAVIVIVLLLLDSLRLSGQAEEFPIPETYANAEEYRLQFPRSFCGLNSLYAATEMFDLNQDYATLISPQYLGDEGSTLAQLKLAGEASGFTAIPLYNLSLSSLKYSPYPLILHVKQNSESQEYNHWVLYMGIRNDQPLIYDVPSKPSPMSQGELSLRWDGVALMLAPEASPRTNWMYMPFLQLGGFALSVFIVLLLLLRCQTVILKYLPHPPWTVRSLFVAAQSLFILAITIIVAISYNLFSPTGFLTQESHAVSIQDGNQNSFLPDITQDTVRKWLDDSDVIIIDARWKRDYLLGHIDNAINIEPDQNEETIQNSLSHLSYNKKIIIYCQSESCPYADNTAKKLQALGYDNVYHYKKGWVDWSM